MFRPVHKFDKKRIRPSASRQVFAIYDSPAMRTTSRKNFYDSSLMANWKERLP